MFLKPELSPRTELPYQAAGLIALFNHVGLLTLFAAFAIWPMVVFNFLSIAIFVVVLVLIRQRRVGLGLFIAIGEVIVHQILAVHFTGWEPGFQLYLPLVGALPLMLPQVPTARRFALASIPVLAFVALFFLHDPSPPNPFPEPVANVLQLINLLIAFCVPWIFVYYFRHGAELVEADLARAALRAEKLLNSILPPSIVERLREGQVVADSFDDVSILFCDIVGFTSLAQKKSPEALVRMLDEVFADFDDLVEQRGLEKIKTIGDAYMVAAGVPEALEDHAQRLAELALAIRASSRDYAANTGEALSLRIGMHRGVAVAGVIGKSKFAYDIWGDAVNTAARMESHGEPGRIHISSEMADVLRDRFEVSPRGEIEIKGMGVMPTFWLEGARPGGGPR
ncbi:Adenylate cyclase [Enhygromyxa salina]|uniref:Adenylate cyclase n=1 Tax=Enhygromyxa salina TaxID=215803 RepID=A0A2S9XNY8_9BACT|nr:Adenylate cyclase [Enhygromyxa salina]